MLLMTAAELVAFFEEHSLAVPDDIHKMLAKLQALVSEDGEGFSPGGTLIAGPGAKGPAARVRDWLDATPSPGLSTGVYRACYCQ
jgi:hypothetical protein